MKHIHKYTSVSHPGLTSEAMSLGIKAAEIRRCESCKKEMTFIQTKRINGARCLKMRRLTNRIYY